MTRRPRAGGPGVARRAALCLAVVGGVALAQPAADRAPTPRAEKEAAWAQAAQGRVDWAVRGVRLYLPMAELEERLRSETVAIRPERAADWKPPAFAQYTETLRLADGAELSATFTSTQGGTVAGALAYVQTLRDGPPLEQLVDSFIQRWGAPDETHAQGTWLTWHLKSRVAVPNGLGAMLRAVVNTDRDRKVHRYSLALSDFALLRDDERRMTEARRAEEARQRESRRADSPKF